VKAVYLGSLKVGEVAEAISWRQEAIGLYPTYNRHHLPIHPLFPCASFPHTPLCNHFCTPVFDRQILSADAWLHVLRPFFLQHPLPTNQTPQRHADPHRLPQQMMIFPLSTPQKQRRLQPQISTSRVTVTTMFSTPWHAACHETTLGWMLDRHV
jgi:hypothetical protein